MARLERWEGSEVAKWVVPGFIRGWGRSVSPRFHLFASDGNQRNEAWPQE